MGRKEQKQRNKGPARTPGGPGLVLNLKREILKQAEQLETATRALRHSNAVAVFLFRMLDPIQGEGPLVGQLAVRIPKPVYSKLLEDDATAIKIEYVGEEAVVSLPPEPAVHADNLKITPGPGGDQNAPTVQSVINKLPKHIRAGDTPTVLGGGIEATPRERAQAESVERTRSQDNLGHGEP